MSRKTVLIVIVCIWVNYLAHAQNHKFTLPQGISPSDYEAGVVLVKVKSSYKDVFQNGQTSARIPKIRASHIKPLLPAGSPNKSAARMAPRKPQVDLKLYYKLRFDKSYPA